MSFSNSRFRIYMALDPSTRLPARLTTLALENKFHSLAPFLLPIFCRVFIVCTFLNRFFPPRALLIFFFGWEIHFHALSLHNRVYMNPISVNVCLSCDTERSSLNFLAFLSSIRWNFLLHRREGLALRVIACYRGNSTLAGEVLGILINWDLLGYWKSQIGVRALEGSFRGLLFPRKLPSFDQNCKSL